MKGEHTASWSPDDCKPRKGPHRLAPSKVRRCNFVREPDDFIDAVDILAWCDVGVRVNDGQWGLLEAGANVQWTHLEGVRRVEVCRPRFGGPAVRIAFRRGGELRRSTLVFAEHARPDWVFSDLALFITSQGHRRAGVMFQGGLREHPRLRVPQPLAHLVAAEMRAKALARGARVVVSFKWDTP